MDLIFFGNGIQKLIRTQKRRAIQRVMHMQMNVCSYGTTSLTIHHQTQRRRNGMFNNNRVLYKVNTLCSLEFH